MALITCKECGHKISSQAATCLSCGAPILYARRRVNRGGIFICVAAVLIVGSMFIISSNEESRKKNPVSARAAITDSAVLITNLDNFEWTAVTVYLNGNPLDGYSAGPYGPVP